MNFLIRFLIFSLLISACEEQEMLSTFKRYTIKAGEHFSNHGVEELYHNTLAYRVVLDNTCKYIIEETDQSDINKLFGFSECNQVHHENSARFGWNWDGSGFEIHAYVYNNSERKSKFLAKVKINTIHDYKIEMDDNNYYFTIEGYVDRVPMERTHKCTKGLYYLLFPYFGGNVPAKKEVNIYMQRIY